MHIHLKKVISSLLLSVKVSKEDIKHYRFREGRDQKAFLRKNSKE